ncbi:hypothetical protein M9458_016893, partial [Cirrhinus mrigala]
LHSVVDVGRFGADTHSRLMNGPRRCSWVGRSLQMRSINLRLTLLEHLGISAMFLKSIRTEPYCVSVRMQDDPLADRMLR